MQVELTEAEVTILKQLARERTPTQRPAVKNSFEPALNITKWFEAQFAKCNKMLPLDPNDDYDFRHRIEHVLQKNEKLMEFVSRTGLSKNQALNMSKSQISAFVAQAEANNAESGVVVTKVAKQEAKQTLMPIHKFLITP